MSGHSKWSTIKHHKAATDAKRGLVFTKVANQISIAVKEGGKITDPDSNFHLRIAIEKAKSINMPKNNIERAIERGVGVAGDTNTLSEIDYEGFGAGKSAILVSCVTDNKQRTQSLLKNIFANHSGHLSGLGTTAYLFQRLGKLVVSKTISENEMLELVINLGGEDFETETDNYVIYLQPKLLHQLKTELEKKQFVILQSEIIYKPKILIDISENDKNQLLKFITVLNDYEDVHAVYTDAKL